MPPRSTEFGRDLTAEAAAGRIDPVIGRSAEIAETVEILARRRKNNAVLIGEAGVGKTAIAEGLALRIHDKDVPETLHDTRIIALDLSGMIAGAQYRGQFEQRLKKALEEATDGRTVLFIDELHTVLGAGNSEGAMDAANILKPLLARGELRVIGATTLAEYRKIERDSALARRFSPVTVEEPTIDDTVEILRGLRGAYESHHGVMINDDALDAAARLERPLHLRVPAARQGDRPRRSGRGQAAPGRRARPAARAGQGRRRRGLREGRVAEAQARGLDPGRGRRDRDRRRGRRPHRDPGGRAGGRRARAPQRPRRRPARPRGRPGDGRRGRVRHDPPRPRRALRARPPARQLPVPRPHRRRQDRAGQGARGAAVRDREGARADRHVRVPRAAHGGAADRLAARLRRLRRRRPADRAGAPPAVQRDPARRDREGPPGRLERAAAGDGRRPADRRRGPHGGLHERRDRHDLEPRRGQGQARHRLHGRASRRPTPRGWRTRPRRRSCPSS